MNKLLLTLLALTCTPVLGMEQQSTPERVVTLAIMAKGTYPRLTKQIRMALGKPQSRETYVFDIVRRCNGDLERLYENDAFPIAEYFAATSKGLETRVTLSNFNGLSYEAPFYDATVVVPFLKHVRLPLLMVLHHNEVLEKWSITG